MNNFPLKESKSNPKIPDRAYTPSWFDRFSAWVDKLPIPNWFAYLLVSFILLGVGLIAQWLGEAGTIKDWDPIFFVAVFQIGFIFIIIHYLDRYGLRALEEFKPAIKESEQGRYPDLKRVISTLPARKTLAVCLISMSIGLVLVLGTVFSEGGIGSTIEPSSDPFGIYTGILMLLLWFTNGLFLYHTYHQLRLINIIYTNLTVVHPFHQRELFAFSGFSARTGIGIVLLTPLWIIFDPGPTSLVICVMFAVIGLIAFILPLLGVRRMLADEKDRLLDENGKQVERTISLMMKELEKDVGAELDTINQSLSSLEKARSQIEAISTWPWKGETLRQLVTAIFLPLLIWIIQYLLTEFVFS